MAKKEKLSQEQFDAIVAEMSAAGFSEDEYLDSLRESFDFPGKYSAEGLVKNIGPSAIEAHDPYWAVQKVPSDPVERKKYFEQNPPQLGILTEKLGLRIPPAITSLAKLGIGTASKLAMTPARSLPVLGAAMREVKGPYEEVPENLVQGVKDFWQDPVEDIYTDPVGKAMTAGGVAGTVTQIVGNLLDNPNLQRAGSKIERYSDPGGEVMGKAASAALDKILGKAIGRNRKEDLYGQMDEEATGLEQRYNLDMPEPMVTTEPRARTALKNALEKGGVGNRELGRIRKLEADLERMEADFKNYLGEDDIGEALRLAREGIDQFADRELDEITGQFAEMNLEGMLIPLDHDPLAVTRAKIAELYQRGGGTPRLMGSEDVAEAKALGSRNVQAFVNKEAPATDLGPGAEDWAGLSSRFSSSETVSEILHGSGQQMTVKDLQKMRSNLKKDIETAKTDIREQQGQPEFGTEEIKTLEIIDRAVRTDLLNTYASMLPEGDPLRGAIIRTNQKMAKMADEMETEAIKVIKNAVDTKFMQDGVDANGDPIIVPYWSAPEAQRASQVVSILFNDGWQVVQSGQGRGMPGVLETSAMPSMRKLVNENSPGTWDKMKINWVHQMFENARDASGRIGPADAIQKELNKLGNNAKDIKARLVEIGGGGTEGIGFANEVLRQAKTRGLLDQLSGVATEGKFGFGNVKAIDKKATRALDMSGLERATMPQIRATIRRLGFGAAATGNWDMAASIAIAVGLEKYSDLVRNPRKFRMTDEAIEAVRSFPKVAEMTQHLQHLGLLVKPIKVGRIVDRSEKTAISREANEAFKKLLQGSELQL